ncbi:cis-zeatin O-beta-D-glucosyltransferase [Salvia divinorum]|uniref:Cis-zeatin O-beta-D-glucosyltransferase n=1 Tax=Salvia divinorum TaxID=28513 RepID=A0ABD1IFA8_SALDI
MHFNQPTNVALVADILKNEIMLLEGKDRSEVVKASRIENVVRRLMAPQEGKRLGRRQRSYGLSCGRWVALRGLSWIPSLPISG